MIEVERRRTIAAPADAVKAVLTDVEQLQRLLPRVERVEVFGSTGNRARLVLTVRFRRLGPQRIEGEARILDNGLRFVAVQPAQIDARWTLQSRGDATEVAAHWSIEPGRMLRTVTRLMPRRLLEERIGREVEGSLQALEEAVTV